MRTPFLAVVLSAALFPIGLDQATAQKPEASEPTTMIVSARVVDAAGKPVPGAGLAMIRSRTAEGDALPVDAKAVHEDPIARSDAEGRIEARIERSSEEPSVLLLSAPGKVCVSLVSPNPRGRSSDGILRFDCGTVLLQDGVDVGGLVRGEDGEPIAGARIHATGVMSRLRPSQGQQPVTEMSYAVSDEKGRVKLYGLPREGARVKVDAAGYFPFTFAHLTRHTPLVATLTPGGEVSGQILAADGRPVADAYVRAYSESSADGETVRSAADGRFRAPIPAPGRYRIRCYIRGLPGMPVESKWSKVYSEPATGVILRVGEEAEREEAAAGKRAVRVAAGGGALAARAVGGAATSKGQLVLRLVLPEPGPPIAEAKATALWWPPQNFQHNRGYLARQLRSAKDQTPDERGRITVPGPLQNQPNTGRVRVAVQGYAPVELPDVEWDENAEENVVEVELETESVLAGVVKDPATGAPVAGVRVFVTDDPASLPVYRPAPLRRTLPDDGERIVTDDEGRFRCPALGHGKHHVFLSHPARADTDPIVVELEKGRATEGVELAMPSGGTLHGKVVGVEIGHGWEVRIGRIEDQGRSYGSYMNASVDQATERVPVAADGTFRIPGLSRSNYALGLLLPSPNGIVEATIDPVRVRTKDLRREFDVGEDMPGTLAGRVELKGAALSPGRLAVFARPNDTDRNVHYHGRPDLRGPHALVAPDGRYTLVLAGERYVIQLVDLATGLVLHQGTEALLVEPTKRLEHDVTAQLAEVRVKLVPQEEGQMLRATRVEIRVEHPPLPNDPRGGIMIMGGHQQDSGTGVELNFGQSEIRVVLPCVPTRFFARSHAHHLDPQVQQYNFPALGEAERTPAADQANEVEIRVSEPQIDIDTKDD